MNLFLKLSDLYLQKQYTNAHFNGNNRSYQKFILLTYMRSGSNHFLDLLRSHEQIISYGNLWGKGLTYPYPGYPTPNSKRLMKYRKKYPVEFVNTKIYQAFNESIRAVGFKISYDKPPQVLDYLRTLPDLKVINLQRVNLLDMHLSYLISRETKKTQALMKDDEQFVKDLGVLSRMKILEKATDPTLPENFKIEVNYEECFAQFEKISSHVEKFQDFFRPEQVLVVYYHDLVNDPAAVSRKVLDFLGVDQKPLKSRFIKINTKKPSEVISNYSQLKERFAGSKWEEYFKE
jgi:hypothetical protein